MQGAIQYVQCRGGGGVLKKGTKMNRGRGFKPSVKKIA